MGAGSRWGVAVVAALACFGACWAGLAAERVLDTGSQVGIASVPLLVVLTVLGAWGERARESVEPMEPGTPWIVTGGHATTAADAKLQSIESLNPKRMTIPDTRNTAWIPRRAERRDDVSGLQIASQCPNLSEGPSRAPLWPSLQRRYAANRREKREP